MADAPGKDRLLSPLYDLLIIGGGVNGCGIARDAAGRGLRIALAEMGDLAQGTSSASTKLIHGGLRYLEHYAFRLVREALEERETLLAIAPHIICPMRFVLPQIPGMRPGWLLRLGLFVYDHLGARKTLPATRTLDLRHDVAGAPLKASLTRAYEYADCWVDDARLVILNAMDAARRGADIMVRARVLTARREADLWRVTLREPGGERELFARCLVNASGAWVGEVAAVAQAQAPLRAPRLVQGSHIVVPRIFDHDRCYILQNDDGRIVFAIPYEGAFTLIGTTDVEFSGDPATAAASEQEIAYLLDAVARYFRRAPERGDVVWSFAGVRALAHDGAGSAKDATREYKLELDALGPPRLDVYGGKITTYRKLAEGVLDRLQPYLPSMSAISWTGRSVLPGGDLPPDGRSGLRRELASLYPWCRAATLDRMVRSYGALSRDILRDVRSAADLGLMFGDDLSEREVRWLMAHEWARTADDVLWRRSKLGLRLHGAARAALARFMGEG